jgi:C1A family cysteine protease
MPKLLAPQPRKVKRFGWIPDLPDKRDEPFFAPKVVRLLRSVNLIPNCPPVYDQDQIGSCTANAIGAALEFDQIRQKCVNIFTPSRLFIYYNERAMEGSIGEDAGASIRDGVKSVNRLGAPPEIAFWPYDIARFAEKPPPKAYEEALNHQAVKYQRIARSLGAMKGCLAAGFPFVLGFTVYDSFESDRVAKTGTVPMPGKKESALGGHAVLAVGYDDAKKRFRMRNSWGTGWGDKGYFTMPYAYLLDENLSDDFWQITVVEG